MFLNSASVPQFPIALPYTIPFVALRLNRMTDRQLLDLRLCDLPLQIKGTHLEQRIEKLYREFIPRAAEAHGYIVTEVAAIEPHLWRIRILT